jgi:predicted RNA-binding Zn-ribbon protein involved in translation (DUF1610 family)
MKDKAEIRCSNIVDRKNKGKVRCSRFLAEISENEIKIPCPNCGAMLIVSKSYTGKIETCIVPKGKPVIEALKEKE